MEHHLLRPRSCRRKFRPRGGYKLRAIRLWLVASIAVSSVLCVLSCANHRATPTGLITQDNTVQDLDRELFLEEPNPGSKLSAMTDLQAELSYVFSQPRTAFVQHEAVYSYETQRTGGNVQLLRGSGQAMSNNGNDSFELTARLMPGEGPNFSVTFVSPDGSQRNFRFRSDLNLYGFHLYSTESIALFQTADNAPPEILKVALNPGNNPAVAYVWRYRITQNESESSAGDGSYFSTVQDPSRRWLSIHQEQLVIPLSENNKKATVQVDENGDGK